MIRNAILVVIFLGVTSFIVKNIYVEEVKKIPQNKAITTIQRSSADRELFRGQFVGVDSIHNVTGDVLVVQTVLGPVLRFERFSTTPGPDLVVYLSKSEDITSTKDLGDQYVTLGSLQKMSGDQTYTLPKQYTDYKSVVIWCRALSILFGAAPIK